MGAIIGHDILAETAMKSNVHPKVLLFGYAQLHELLDEEVETMFRQWQNHGHLKPKVIDYLLDYWKPKPKEV